MYNTKIQVNVSKKEKFFMIKCTIAIPVYNREKFIGRAIDSALEQNVSDLEILIVDNCSTDHTWGILQTYKDSRLRLVRNESNIGLIGNFNKCLSLARGKYIKFLCSDDKLTSSCLKREIEIMENNSNVVLLSSRGQLVDINGKFIAMFADYFPQGIYLGKQALFSWLWFQSHYGYNPLNYHPGVLLRSQSARESGGFDITMKVGGDVDLYLRMLEKGDLAVSDTIDCEITVHVNQESNYLKEDGGLINDLFLLNERYRDLLETKDCYSSVMQQTSAIALGMSLRLFFSGRIKASKVHWKLAHSAGFGFIRILTALIKLAILRVILKTTGMRITRLPLPFKYGCML